MKFTIAATNCDRKGGNQVHKYLNLKEMLDMLTVAHTNYATRPVFFTLDHRRCIANSITLSVYGDEYELTYDGDMKYITSNDMINMMRKIYELYGDRLVKVAVETTPWNVTDLKFQTSGRDYCFICEKT